MISRLEVHSHDHYSNLRIIDAICKPKALVEYAQEIGLKGICSTNHECLSASVEYNKIAKELHEKGSDFKIGLGNEIYLTDTRENGIQYYHLILIAKNAEGFKQLRQLSSLAWMNSYWDRGLERVPTLKSELAEIVKQNPGNLICTTACLGGELSSNILEMEKARKVGDTLSADTAKQNIIDFVLFMKDLFNEDFYFEVAPGQSKEQIIANKKIAELSNVFNVKMVIGSDAHYLKKEDRYVHKAFLNSKSGEREVDSFYEYSYLQNEEEIIENLTPSIVDLYEEMCKNSMEIYDKIEFYDLEHSQQIPKVEVKDYHKTEWKNEQSKEFPILNSMLMSDDKVERYWVNECINKLDELGKRNKDYLDRLEEEADIKRTIGKALNTNMFAYPVTLQHYVDLFWECGSTVGAGRGSSCSGLNHYLLGVTQLDPLEWSLPFWRYLNKARYELGDIDLDLCPSKRPLILQKIKEERGQNFLPEINEITKENCGCTLIATFGTETTKSAIQTACRGYRNEEYTEGIDVDTAQYLSSLVPSERGFLWDLHTVVYGDKEKDRKPVIPFIKEVEQYPGLLEVMFGIEGLISRRGSHASGVILFDEDPYKLGGCFMKTPSGDVCTQFDLHDAEYCGLTKYDFLVTSIQDKIVQAIKFLQEDEQIDSSLTLREAYNKYFHPNIINIEDEEIWDKIDKVEILDLFQFDSAVGSQAAKKIKPRTMYELSDANGLMRLMTGEKGEEQPIDKYVRFKNNISLWYDEMNKYGLTKEEQEALKPHFLKSHGVPPSQEQLMTMLMDENICSFSLKDANAARKIVGKKQMSKIPALKEQVMNQAKSEALGKYVWDCGIGPQMGYSFSVIHALAYSFIAYQSAFIATKWNPIYWNAACLVVNSGSLEAETENQKSKGSDYGKIAKAIGEIRNKGINLSLININESDYSYKPDEKNNRILYGLKAISGMNDETIEKIVAGRPYAGIKDFMSRCPLTKTSVLNLIKAGAFDEIDQDFPLDRKSIMIYYLMKNCDAKNRLTLQNFNGLVQHGLIPQELEFQVRIYNFTKYLKANRKVGQYFTFDDISLSFFDKFLSDEQDKLEVINGVVCIRQTVWDKIYKSCMDAARVYIKENQEKMLREYNQMLFKEVWDKYADEANMSKQEMNSLCFYYHEHELAHIDNNRYGFSNFNEIPSEEIDYFFKRGGKEIPIYKIRSIAGTVLAKDDNRTTITVLTTSGVVNVKFSRDQYAKYKAQLSEKQPDGKKVVKEKSWFRRGTILVISGFRREDTFVSKTYANTERHSLYKVTEICGNELKLQHDRWTSAEIIEEEGDY